MTNHEAHKLLWGSLAKSGSLDKDGTFQKLFPDQDIESAAYQSACFACQEAEDRNKAVRGFAECDCCPVEWSSGDCNCMTEGSEYLDWAKAKSAKERKRCAAKIRDLPWKEK